MKILLLAKYDYAGASSRYRTLQYLDFLKQNGIHVTVNSLLDNRYISKIYSNQKASFFYSFVRYLKRALLLFLNKNKYDLYWIEGELFPYIPLFLEKIFLPKKYIVEYDDAIFHNYDLHRSKLVRFLLGTKIKKIMKKGQHVIVGNEYVKQYAKEAGTEKITILPTVVDANVYKPDPKISTNEATVVGWLGSPSTVKYISQIEPVLLAIAKKHNVKFHVIGGEYNLKGIETFCYHWPNKWSEEEEIHLLNQIDIGIMPLIDSSWEKGKCGFKLIKYMACAKPVIASPVSTNIEIITDGVTGYLANSFNDWEDKLVSLIKDKEKSSRFGLEGRKKMVNHYSLQYTAPILCNILKNSI